MFESSFAIPLKQPVGGSKGETWSGYGVFEISFVHSEDKDLTVPAPFRTPQYKFRFCPDVSSDNL